MVLNGHNYLHYIQLFSVFALCIKEKKYEKLTCDGRKLNITEY